MIFFVFVILDPQFSSLMNRARDPPSPHPPPPPPRTTLYKGLLETKKIAIFNLFLVKFQKINVGLFIPET